MPPSFSLIFLLLADRCFLVSSFQTKDPHHAQYDSSLLKLPNCQKIVLSISNMSFFLFRAIAQRSNDTNIFFAPLRIAAGLTMLALATKGDTHKQIMEGLNLNHTDLSEDVIHKCFHNILPTLHQPNEKSAMTGGMSLFIHSRLKLVTKFLKDIKELYHIKAIALNFTNNQEAKKQINHHVRKKTFTEIVTVFKDLDRETDLALVDYMCFHGKWYDEFKAQRVVKEEFHLDTRTTIKVPMVNRMGIYYLKWVKELSSLVLLQPDLGSAMAFFIMPDKGKMQQVEQMLTYQHLIKIRQTFNQRTAKLHFPVLSISAMYDLESVLRPLGITQVFNNWTDYSGITKDEPLKRSKVVHKALLTFDDKGTGASGNPFFNDGFWRNTPNFKFNNPFILFIKSEVNNFPLFMGRIVNPRR